MKKILIVGASSFIGTHLAMHFRDRYQVIGTYSRHKPRFDEFPCFRFLIQTGAPIQEFVRLVKPDVIVYCAGYADDKVCSEDPMGTLFLNADAPTLFAEALAERNGHLIFLSSSKVFSGEDGDYHEEDPPSPNSTYGSAKRRGEELLSQYQNTFIVRLGTAFGWGAPGHHSIVNRVLAQLWRNSDASLICDEFRSFIAVDELAHCLEILLNTDGAGGIYHISPPDKDSYFSFGRLLAKTFEYPPELIHPMMGKEFSERVASREKRGKDLTLNGSHFAKTFSYTPASPEESLRRLRKKLLSGRQ